MAKDRKHGSSAFAEDDGKEVSDRIKEAWRTNVILQSRNRSPLFLHFLFLLRDRDGGFDDGVGI
jgi:hypothetical protein